ncbi:hypothetical protein RHSIM_Rhsim09G0001900 [Rhododendron simsii]|uniref:Uncharacterized protein n=1 Tax=Rhododendron simsii TaxID=118357 RepID=A0A834GFW5_RHOSS|nr:hypothetical protein RHSIM_Rhsim09G0001900 [Rhododendron simsii]
MVYLAYHNFLPTSMIQTKAKKLLHRFGGRKTFESHPRARDAATVETRFTISRSVVILEFTSIPMLLLDLLNSFIMSLRVCEQCPNVKCEREEYLVTVDIEKGMQDGQVRFRRLYSDSSYLTLVNENSTLPAHLVKCPNLIISIHVSAPSYC